MAKIEMSGGKSDANEKGFHNKSKWLLINPQPFHAKTHGRLVYYFVNTRKNPRSVL
jgi:hypothetical protein